MKDHDIYYVIDCVASILVSPLWEAEVLSFVDEKCIIFDSEEENKLLFSEVHKEFVNLVDTVLVNRLSEFGISEEQFSAACLEYNSRCKESKRILNNGVIDQIHAMADFLGFKTMMLKRNMELQIEAMEALQRIDGSCKELWKHLNELKATDETPTCIKTKSLEISDTLVVEDPSCQLSAVIVVNDSSGKEEQEAETKNDIQSIESSQRQGLENSGNMINMETPLVVKREEDGANLFINTIENDTNELIESSTVIARDYYDVLEDKCDVVEGFVDKTNEKIELDTESAVKVTSTVNNTDKEEDANAKEEEVQMHTKNNGTEIDCHVSVDCVNVPKNEECNTSSTSLKSSKRNATASRLNNDNVTTSTLSRTIHSPSKSRMLDRHNRFKRDKLKQDAQANVNDRKNREEHLKKQREKILKRRDQSRRAKLSKEDILYVDKRHLIQQHHSTRQKSPLSSKMKYLV